MDATYVQTNFLGGEVSLFAQGRTDRPDYRTMMTVCLNGIPVEAGTWVRRPGTRHASTTRGGAAAREIPFEFKQATPYNMEFSDAHVRFRSGPVLVTTNDSVTVTTVSSANPAVVQTSAAVTWVTGDQAYFTLLGTTAPLLQNRVFALTKVDTTHFSLADAVTGAAINGSTLAWVSTPAAVINRVLDLASPYVSGTWGDLKWVQAERQTILLRGGTKPYTLSIVADPTTTTYATFALNPIVFRDGPYLDPIAGGALATPSAKIGIINITVSFNAYDATVAYSVGDFVTSSSVNYKSLIDANVGNTPVSSPSQWVAVDASTAIVNPDGSTGFDGRDVGRMIRLFSQPALWVAATTYSAGNYVVYNDVAYVAAAGSTGVIPGSDPTKWSIAANAQQWTWGRVTALLSQISQTLSGSLNIGNMSGGGGLAAAFDGIIQQSGGASAQLDATGSYFGGGSPNFQQINGYVGRNYSGASAQHIAWATIYPSTDQGLARFYAGAGGISPTLTLNLRAKASAPASSSDGTLLGTVTLANTLSAVTINSNDTTTTWNYVWIEYVLAMSFSANTGTNQAWELTAYAAEVQFFNPPGTGTATGITVQIVGPALLYTFPVRTWRLGAFSDKTAWPTCGTWHEGRLGLSGAIDNRFDLSVPNDPFNFAPTGPSGAVADANAISYTLNAPSVNPVRFMVSDQQGIVIGTQAGGFLVQATANNNVLTPTSIQAHQIKTMDGVADMLPADAGSTLLLVHRYKRKLQEYFADVYSGKFQAQNVSWKAKHLLTAGLAQVVMQEELAPIMWGRDTAGALVGMTYKRENMLSSQEPNFSAWHRHTLGSGRTVASLCVGPSIDGTLDSVSMVTQSAASGIYHVEILTDIPQEGDTLAEAWFLDDAAAATSTTSSSVTPSPYGGLTLNGLWHLNGQTVTAWLGGLDCGDFPVANGAITVPYGDGLTGGTANGQFTAQFVTSGVTQNGITMFTGTMPSVVGFTYTSDGQIVRPHTPAESGARNGPAFGKLRRTAWLMALLEGTQGISFGTTFDKLLPALFRRANGASYPANQTFSGMLRMTVTDGDTFDSMLCWRVTRPYPANVITIGAALQTKDI